MGEARYEKVIKRDMNEPEKFGTDAYSVVAGK